MQLNDILGKPQDSAQQTHHTQKREEANVYSCHLGPVQFYAIRTDIAAARSCKIKVPEFDTAVIHFDQPLQS